MSNNEVLTTLQLEPALVREQLARILDSPHFTASERLRRFLHYVVEETLAGRQDRIKGFAVAMEVFGRDENFDPQNDPVVRIEAGRLRRALEHYYLVVGAEALVVIEIPKGAYVPRFSEAMHSSRPHLPESYERLRHQPYDDAVRSPQPRLAVLPFTVLGSNTAAPLYAASLGDETISALSRFKELCILRVHAPDRPEAGAIAPLVASNTDYVLESSVRADDTRLRVTCRLLYSANAAVIWTDTHEVALTTADLFHLPGELAGRIATAIAQPYGAIFRAEAVKLSTLPPAELSSYGTLEYYLYRAAPTAELHLKLRSTLEGVLRRHPDYATAWAMLSYTQLDEDRFGFNRTPLARERALDSARASIRLDPHNVRGLQALMIALVFNGQPDEALAVCDAARALNPNDTELLAQAAQIVGMLGDWSESRRLFERALALNPGHTGIYHSNYAMTLYMLGDLETALYEIETANVPHLPMSYFVAALIYGELGIADRAKHALGMLSREQPDLITNIWAELGKRCYAFETQQRMVASLRKAGAQISPPPGVPGMSHLQSRGSKGPSGAVA